MSEIQQQILDLEDHLKMNEAAAERRAALVRLGDNRDFKRLIREEFMTDDCARFAQLSVDPSLNAEQRADCLAKAQSAGHLKQYLAVIMSQGFTAESTIVQINEALDELRGLDDADPESDEV